MCTPKEIAENYLSACAAAGADVFARLPCGRVRRACGRRVHGCRGDGRRSVAGKARLRLRVSGRPRHGHRGRKRALHRQQSHGHGRSGAHDHGAADAAQLARCLSGQLCGRSARCGAVRVGARLFRVRRQARGVRYRHRTDESGADVRRCVRARHPLQLPRVHRRLDGQCRKDCRREDRGCLFPDHGLCGRGL